MGQNAHRLHVTVRIEMTSHDLSMRDVLASLGNDSDDGIQEVAASYYRVAVFVFSIAVNEEARSSVLAQRSRNTRQSKTTRDLTQRSFRFSRTTTVYGRPRDTELT